MHHLNKVEEISTEGIEFDSDFAQDVFLGLSHEPKWLSSKYFYDKVGDRIFQQIMQMDSYYLTDAELGIFKKKKEKILKSICQDGEFRLIELGAGDGMKTKVLLRYFLEQGVNFEYAPSDISSHVLSLLKRDLKSEMPELCISLLEGDYFETLADNLLKSDKKSVILFLGSNIGNFSRNSALDFLKKVRKNMKADDLLMVGFDLKKDPDKILRAYNDEGGVTASFNLNLLERINHELGGQFDVNNFKHHPVYDPVSGECRSYLLSRKQQSVFIEALDREFQFKAWEPIFMEISKKFTYAEISHLATSSGFQPIDSFVDDNEYFVDDLWQAI